MPFYRAWNPLNPHANEQAFIKPTDDPPVSANKSSLVMMRALDIENCKGYTGDSNSNVC